MNKTNHKLKSSTSSGFCCWLRRATVIAFLGGLLSTSTGFAQVETTGAGWTDLLDAKLTHWELWMGVPHQSVLGLPPGTPTSSDGHEGKPLGLQNDPKQVFSVITEDGQTVLKITGEIFGGLTSLQTYSNYCLHVQFKWGVKKWEPKLNALRDNGILFHCSGPHGAFWNVWKQSVEFQVEEQNMGHAYFLAGTSATATATNGGGWHYDPAGKPTPFGDIPGSANFMVSHLPGDFEKPDGEWNTLELYTLGNAAIYVVNGQVVQVLHDIVQSGKPEPLNAGQIQIQSEGAEAYYRDIKIKPITNFPEEFR